MGEAKLSAKAKKQLEGLPWRYSLGGQSQDKHWRIYRMEEIGLARIAVTPVLNADVNPSPDCKEFGSVEFSYKLDDLDRIFTPTEIIEEINRRAANGTLLKNG